MCTLMDFHLFVELNAIRKRENENRDKFPLIRAQKYASEMNLSDCNAHNSNEEGEKAKVNGALFCCNIYILQGHIPDVGGVNRAHRDELLGLCYRFRNGTFGACRSGHGTFLLIPERGLDGKRCRQPGQTDLNQ